MLQKPRPFTTTFFNWKELTTSIIQGLIITAGTLILVANKSADIIRIYLPPDANTLFKQYLR